MVLITPILPRKASHFPIMDESLLVPCLGRAFFWNTKFNPNLVYFFSVFTFYSINKIFRLLATYSSPKFNGPFESCFNIFSSSIFYSNNFFIYAFIFGFVYFFYFFSIFLVFWIFGWIFGMFYGAFFIDTSTISYYYDSDSLSKSLRPFWLLIDFDCFQQQSIFIMTKIINY